jgi:riboflavin-specific deaminase-like protein
MDTGLDPECAQDWQRLLQGDEAAMSRWPLYAPFLAPAAAADGCMVLGRIAQTLDGRIATANGASFWISGPQDILHTHRLRALAHAIVVGAGTVQTDDPQLTTRACAGPSPVRIILDTERRLDARRQVFAGGPTSLVMVAEDCPGPDRLGEAEVIRLRRHTTGAIDLGAVLETLAGRGLTRVFVEGGGVTVSRFLAAGLLDRLHVTLAPLLLGAGIPAFTLPDCGHPENGMRLSWELHRLGEDVLLDIPLHRARPPACR